MWPFYPPGDYSVTPIGPLVAVDETNASCVVKLTGRAFINAANDVYGGNSYVRYNRSRVIDCGSRTDTILTFKAICLPGIIGAQADPYVAVLVNGVLFATVPINVNTVPTEYAVVGLPAGAKNIQLWDGWQARTSTYDQGIDGKISGTYVLGVRVPGGQPVPAKITAASGRGIVVMGGDSTNDYFSTEPFAYYGWAGQLRRALAAVGGLFGYLTYGAQTLCGDGPTAAQTAVMIHDLWADMGATNKQLIYNPVYNDARYYDLGGSIQTTPTQLATYLAAVLDALTISDPGYSAFLVTPTFPIGTSQLGPNGGGFFHSNYQTSVAGVAGGRVQVVLLDGTTWGMNLGTDYAEAGPDQVHPNQLGQNKIFNNVSAALGGL
jgi:hypothetical protein